MYNIALKFFFLLLLTGAIVILEFVPTSTLYEVANIQVTVKQSVVIYPTSSLD